MDTKKQQKALIECINHELAKKTGFYKPSPYYHSVWFQCSTGRFIYADKILDFDVVVPLIENKTLVFKAVVNHQGEKMLRYVLAYYHPDI